MTRRAPLVWAALLIPLWIAFVLCTHWEPVLRDSWGHYLWHRQSSVTLGSIWQFARGTYLGGNPRLGQTWTMLLATPGPWHSIVTPIVELWLFVQLGALALGRWPSPRRTDDALVVAAILALVAISAPQLGPMLFYRPFIGNYTFGFAASLAFVLPYRFALSAPRARGWWWAPIMLVAGAAAGLSDEHTAPTCAAAACLASLVAWRRGQLRAWMVAGALGALAGGLALLLAPGQDVRYGALATQASIGRRIADRGVVFDLGVALAPLYYARWIALAAGIALAVRRWRGGPGALALPNRRSALLLVAAAFAIAITLLASPKVGPRLYFASVCLLATAVAGVVVPMLAGARLRLAAWLPAAAAIAHMLVACVNAYAILGRESAQRLETLAHAPKGTDVEIAPYTLPRSRWFIGEDFIDAGDRAKLAKRFGLAGIHLTTEPTDCDGCRMTLAEPRRPAAGEPQRAFTPQRALV